MAEAYNARSAELALDKARSATRSGTSGAICSA